MTTKTPSTGGQPPIHPERQRRVKTALRIFSISAWVTGALLLLLVVRMIMQYVLHLDVHALAWVARVHGLAFIVFLMASLNLGTKARWSATEWLTTALSGIVPVMSFIIEAMRRREVTETFRLDEA
ncbi:DUF3817 domain-containing protein [Corynebacterium liangguodongii]|uniref:DUF3817 domain-containing protein n=1 Tax=Corynebacterium liangguodongii TaxID=2079535 RepID=A0A2S0WFM5_9CORY|nr:DUF3817 domain-containing protein [Corynebacterium liangguodongii]AWB84571.1 DUF3817 domain-containing protein [Corynebacterium liangguodongii]PWB98844.1 DUF3817 domain-containing protein [Corynebacterium liangguodongii]